MFARLSAKAILLAAAMALAFFGVGLIGLCARRRLAPLCRRGLGHMPLPAAIFLLPPLVWAVAVIACRRAGAAAAKPALGRS